MNMQSILRWSLENSDSQGAPSGSDGGQPPRPIDPEILDAILGKPDSELMKEALAVATDELKDEDTKLTALDDFEMLIEQIDNANNIEKMGMWPTIQSLLTSPTSTDSMRAAVLWIIGTAVQNNPSAQSAYLSLPESPLSSILSYLSPTESSSATRSKAVYALSGLLKHNAKGVSLLSENGGWQVMKDALEDPDITVRRKVVFLLNALLLPCTIPSTSVAPASSTRVLGGGLSEPSSESQPVHPNSHVSLTAETAATAPTTLRALQDYGFVPTLVRGLISPVPHGRDGDQEGDVDLEEKLVRLFYTLLLSSPDGSNALEKKDKADLNTWIEKRSDIGEQWDLGKEELHALQCALK